MGRQAQLDLCKTVFQVPIVKIVLSPAEEEWYRSTAGLGLDRTLEEDEAFGCPADWYLVPSRKTNKLEVWADMQEDPNTAGTSIATGPNAVRFYARCALQPVAASSPLGHLCVADRKPRPDFGTVQRSVLEQMADLAAALQTVLAQHQLLQPGLVQDVTGADTPSLRFTTGIQRPVEVLMQYGSQEMAATQAVDGLHVAVDCFQDPSLLVDVREEGAWRVPHTNAALQALIGTGIPLPELFWDLFEPVEQPGWSAAPARPTAPFAALFRPRVGQSHEAVVAEFRPAAVAMQHTEDDDDDSNASPPPFFFGLLRSYDGSAASGGSAGGEGSAPTVADGRGTSRGSGGVSLPMLNAPRPSVFHEVLLGQLIGRGAYGRVFKATWNGNTVAVKVMRTDNPELFSVQGPTGRVRKAGLFEAALSSSLSHPNVANTYAYAVRPVDAVGQASGAAPTGLLGAPAGADLPPKVLHEVWIVSEFCNLGPLLAAIERGAFLTQPFVARSGPNLVAILQTLQEIAAALEYLHMNDILHGDLTGGNVLLAASGKDGRGFTAKVVDFGLSRIIGNESYLRTRTLGCAEYMPPELITDGLMTRAGDVYAFGVVMWELYMGQRAWAGLKSNQVLGAVASKQMLAYPDQTPKRLKELGTKCLCYYPAQRPTFTEILHEVGSILRDTHFILRKFLAAQAQVQAGTQ